MEPRTYVKATLIALLCACCSAESTITEVDSIAVTASETSRTGSTVGPSMLFECGFEDSLCGMTQRTGDDFDWTRHRGGTSSDDTGPDGASQGAWYMYIETSHPRVAGDKAYLETPDLNFEGPVCVRFAYHMYGEGVKRLKSFLNSEGEKNDFFKAIGDQGNQWNHTRIDVEMLSNDTIVYVGVRGTSNYGDIAVDNVAITSGSCTDSDSLFTVTTDVPTAEYNGTTFEDDFTSPVIMAGSTGSGVIKDVMTTPVQLRSSKVSTTGLHIGYIIALMLTVAAVIGLVVYVIILKKRLTSEAKPLHLPPSSSQIDVVATIENKYYTAVELTHTPAEEDDRGDYEEVNIT